MTCSADVDHGARRGGRPRPVSARGRRAAGFSLIELAVVLVIIGLLVGGGIGSLVSGVEQSRRSEQKRQLGEIRDALYGFAMSEGRLPCPDTTYPPDGAEDVDGSDHCDADEGALPWQELGLGRRDAWGHPLRYRVEASPDPDFADPPADPDGSSFTLAEDGGITVRDGGGNIIVANTPAVVVSFGAQGSQVWTGGGYVCPGDGIPAAGFSGHETENCDGNETFVVAGFRGPEAADGRFDDLGLWLALPVLKARMVEAGRLP